MENKANRPVTPFGYLLIALVAGWLIGLMLVVLGALSNDPSGSYPNQNGYAGVPFIIAGVIFIVLPSLAMAAYALVKVTQFTIAGEKQYRAWKRTLTPEQLTAVRLAETAALLTVSAEAHRKFREHHKQVAAKQAEFAVHGPKEPWWRGPQFPGA